MAGPTARFAIIEAPSILGLRPTGVDQLPAALRRHRLVERLDARIAATLAPPSYDAARPPGSGTLNADGIARFSVALADAAGGVLATGERPLVLGGDCSILLGSLLAFRRRGRYGLLFVDGHADFYQPEANPNGEAASMDLAFATGRGPAALADLEGLRPLVRDEDVVAFGFRDHDEQRVYGSQPLAAKILSIDLPAVRRVGIEAAVAQAMQHLASPDLDGVFVHVDADVLDDAIMPAVDYRQPGGLAAAELIHLLRAANDSGRLAGLEVTIYNPALDADEAAGRLLAEALVAGLTPRPRS
ncbi:MAG: arginase family protein [Vicinamibacteraceae bacterium]